MEDIFLLGPFYMQKTQTMEELRQCNEFTVNYGLYLSEQQIRDLTERRFEALRNTGRIEFGKGIIKRLIAEFCDSPYITQDNYEETILELQDCFYYFKNESMDRIPDGELISFMKRHFDGYCQGSLEYLSGTTLEELCRRTRYSCETDDDELF